MSKRRPKDPRLEVNAVRMAVEAFSEVVVPAMEDKLGLFAREGERLPDLEGLAILVLRCAQWRCKRLEKAENARLLAGLALEEPRRCRDETCQRLRGLLRQLRDLARVLSRWGGGWIPRFLVSPIPADPVALMRYAREVCDELRELSPEQLPQGAPLTFDPDKLVVELDQAATVLNQALQEINAGEAEVPHAQHVKEKAKAGFEADCAAGLRLLTALGTYAGNPLIANLVKRHRKRSR